MKISIKLGPGGKRFLRQTKTLETKLMGHMNVAFRKAGNTVRTRMRSIMASGWPSNEKHYRDWKIKHGYDPRPLFRTHLLANSISNIRISSSPALFWSRIGWEHGAQYGGLLAEKIYKGRVPGHRKKALPIKSYGPFSRRSTMPLEVVAYYNNRTRPFVDRTYSSVRLEVVAQITHAFFNALGVN